MMRKYPVRFGRGRMEKDAAGCPSLPTHYGPTNPGTSRTSPAATTVNMKNFLIQALDALRLGLARARARERLALSRSLLLET
jgi:hypothetical protein